MKRDVMARATECLVPAGSSRYGFVVGIERYQEPGLEHQFAATDARAVFDLMTDPLCGMFPEDQVGLLLDEEATMAAVQNGLRNLVNNAAPGDTLWVYFAGMGVPDKVTGASRWLVYDSRLDDIMGTSVGPRDLDELLASARTHNLVLYIDCHHPARLAEQCLGDGGRSAFPHGLYAGLQRERLAALCATPGAEPSLKLGIKRHSAFNQFLVEGLRGEADTAGNRDGVVDLGELWEHLRIGVLSASEGAEQQQPLLLGEPPKHLALTMNAPVLEQLPLGAVAVGARPPVVLPLPPGLVPVGGEVGLVTGLPRTVENAIGMRFVLVPAGEFLMGEPDDGEGQDAAKPRHRVAITQPLYMAAHVVTQAQYAETVGASPSRFREPANPVERISWHEAQVFVERLTENFGAAYGLPTEAEWEYACRAGTDTAYSFGDDSAAAGDYAWGGENSDARPHKVGLLPANAWGLHDMHGNVWEWCADWFGAEYYARSPRENPTGPTTGQARVVRGGSWRESTERMGSSCRHSSAPTSRRDDFGLRCVVRIGSGPGALSGRPSAVAAAPDELVILDYAGLPEGLAPASGESDPVTGLPSEVSAPNGMEFVLISPGNFDMGSTETEARAEDCEWPQHRVEITQPFYLGKYPVVQEEYEAFVGANPSFAVGDRNPVECVSWADAVVFCERLREETGLGYTLPTEAQWEYACRAGTSTVFYFGDDYAELADHAWYKQNSEGQAQPVGQFPANPWGLFDMHGNVWEWCRDWFDYGYYEHSLAQDPEGPSSGQSRVLRGGSWYHDAHELRCAYRRTGTPDTGVYDYGFRCVILL